jgi:cell division protein FtsN
MREKTELPVLSATEPALPEPAGGIEIAAPAATHYLVAGSFKSRHNALVLHGKLQSEGFHCEVIESEKGMYRVSLFSTHDRVEALNMLREMRAGRNSQDVWLLSMKQGTPAK